MASMIDFCVGAVGSVKWVGWVGWVGWVKRGSGRKPRNPQTKML